MTPEGKVKKQLKDFFEKNEIFYFMPVPTGYGRKTIDFFVCFYGQFIGIETKATDQDKPTALQQKELDNIGKSGGETCVINADNVELFLVKFEAMLKEAKRARSVHE